MLDILTENDIDARLQLLERRERSEMRRCYANAVAHQVSLDNADTCSVGALRCAACCFELRADAYAPRIKPASRRRAKRPHAQRVAPRADGRRVWDYSRGKKCKVCKKDIWNYSVSGLCRKHYAAEKARAEWRARQSIQRWGIK